MSFPSVSLPSRQCRTSANAELPESDVESATSGSDFAKWTRIGGAGLAATGLLHFVAPQLFVPITRPAFPEQTERFVTVNGTLETLLGTALVARRTRTFGFIGLLVYVGYLAFNAKTTRDAAAAEAARPNVVRSAASGPAPQPSTEGSGMR